MPSPPAARGAALLGIHLHPRTSTHAAIPACSAAFAARSAAAQPRTVLWVDSAGDARQPTCKLLAAHHITVHCVDSFAEALGQIPRLHPHLLLLAYPPAAAADMRYETFVYTELPRVDPYRPPGAWAVNPWHYTEIPILLQAADLAPGCLAPLLHRAYPLSTPYEPCLLLPRVQTLLPPPTWPGPAGSGSTSELQRGWHGSGAGVRGYAI